jgi:hypothetical protein
MVWVTNTTSVDHKDTYAFEVFHFPAKKSVEIDEDKARHFFGYQMSDRAPVLARLGWALTMNDLPDGLKKLDRFVITETNPAETHDSLSPVVVERVPLPPSKAAGRKPAISAVA